MHDSLINHKIDLVEKKFGSQIWYSDHFKVLSTKYGFEVPRYSLEMKVEVLGSKIHF
jgi:hypothetical protein